MAKTKKKLGFILYFFLILFCVLPVFLIVITQLYINNQAFSQIRDNDIEHSLKIVEHFFNQKNLEALAIAQKYSQNAQWNDFFNKRDRDALDKETQDIFVDLKKESGVTVLEFGDANGVVFLRAHNPGKFGDDKSTNQSINMALSGKEVYGLEFGKSGLALRAFVPIKDQDKIIGTFQIGYNFNEQVLKDITVSVKGDISLFQNDILLFTT